ncbi:MAG: DUF362 domain-containing protein [Lachnospiraceae bacterium]|nr:DUF362 domain-containing protein [Lachnospiraceae bacterium]
MPKVYIEHRKTGYPQKSCGFAPSIQYPEYAWDDLSKEPNEVYDMVRACLHGYGLDDEHYGLLTWNPLGELIKKGDTVVIKPNWVEEKNENSREGIECLVTHASVIRAVIDYVHLALKGSGRLIVGDSPMPDCDLKTLMKAAGYDKIWASCRERGIPVEVLDFREDIVTGFANQVKQTSGDSEVIVDLKEDSFFAEIEEKAGRYRNGIVDATKMNRFYHAGGHHRYGINREVLKADVIINLCKPKTHRKAGYTAALKNYIGICSRKISIPHNVTGSQKEGGDTYFGPRIIFGTEGKLRDMETYALSKGQNAKGRLLKCMRIPFWMFRRITHQKYYGTGNWYRNDTIWRAILDINRIMVYADKRGRLRESPQRKFLTIGDMIVAGEKNGPLGPSAKRMGMVLISEDPVAFDRAAVRVMGFDEKKLPVLSNIFRIGKYPMKYSQKVFVDSNDQRMAKKELSEMPAALHGCFQPAEGWDCIRRKKICYVATIPMTLKAFVLSEAIYMHEHGGCDITFISSETSEEDRQFIAELPEYIHYYALDLRRGFSLSGIKAIKEMRRIFEKEKFDMVQYSTPFASLYASVAAKRAGIPVRLYCQCGMVYVAYAGWKRMILKQAEKYICRTSTWVEPVSHKNLQLCWEDRIYPRTKGSVVWNGSSNGVNLKRFDSSQKEKWRFDVRNQYGISQESYVIGFVGRICRDKGINELLEAARNMLKEHTDIVLFLVGPKEGSEKIQKELRIWARKSRQVVFAGFVDHAEKYMAAMDVLVFPSYREGFGNVVIEAEAMKVPVIVSNIPGPTEGMKRNETGLVVPARESKSLQKAMEYLYRNRDVGEKFGQAGEKFVKTHFAQDKLNQKILQDRIRLLETTIRRKV